MRIEPTIGRIVWYWPSLVDGATRDPQPLAAIVAHVNQDGTVNLGIFDRSGDHYKRTHVPLIQEGDAEPERDGFCQWMPYQIGQAKKHAGEPSASPDVTQSPAPTTENAHAPTE